MSAEVPTEHIIEFSFKLVHFKELSFSMLSEYRKLEASEDVEFTTNLVTSVSSGPVMTIVLEVFAKEKGIEEASELVRVKTELVVKFESEDIKTLPRLLLLNLVMVAFASTRGVLSIRTKGTFMEEITLPIIDASTLLRSTPTSLQNWFG